MIFKKDVVRGDGDGTGDGRQTVIVRMVLIISQPDLFSSA